MRRCRPRACTSAPVCWWGRCPTDSKVTNWAKETVSAEQLKRDFDAIVLTGGAEVSRDLPVPGRDLAGVHFAMEFLPQQNKINAGDKVKGQLRADGKHVVVIGGGDTGSDCVGTSNRHGAKSVTQFELLPMPPEQENKSARLAVLADQAAHFIEPRRRLRARVRDRHQGVHRRRGQGQRQGQGAEGGARPSGRAAGWSRWRAASRRCRPTWCCWRWASSARWRACSRPSASRTMRAATPRAHTEANGGYATNVAKVFAAGDMRRGQSLVVWAIREGRQAAQCGRRVPDGHERPAALNAPANRPGAS